MTLRLKLVASFVVLTAVATVGLGVWTYAATSQRLHHEIDQSLRTAAYPLVDRLGGPLGADWPPIDDQADQDAGPGRIGGLFERSRSFEQIFVQVINRTGTPVIRPRTGAMPVGEPERQVAAASGSEATVIRTLTWDGEHYRVLTSGVPRGAVQVARSLAETDRLLRAIRNRTLMAVGLVSAVAALVGWVLARQATRRLVLLTDTAETVADTGRLDLPVPSTGRDEVGRLGHAFESMLVALGRSREDQQRLVQDAGHELRTPLTSLRTNVAVLRRYDGMPAEVRRQVIEDIESETGELAALVDELVELATDRRNEEPETPVSLGEIATHVVDRVRRRTGRMITITADESVVMGRRSALDRAIGNLLENAAKFSADDHPIEVTVAAGRIQVDDRGPGIPPADLSRVFERFYRSVDARSQPGSGLGLAIVNDVALAHGGSVFVANRDGGGASIGLVLPPYTGERSPSH